MRPSTRGRLAAAVLAGLLVLPGCAAPRDAAPSPVGEGAVPPRCGPDGSYTIGMSQANLAESFYRRQDEDVRAAAAEVPQLTVRFADAVEDNSRQVAQIEEFLRQPVDLLIVSPNEPTPLTGIVKKAFDQGVPVIVLGRDVKRDDYTALVAPDDIAIGREAGHFLAGALPDGGPVAELRGLPGSAAARDRAAGLAEALAGTSTRLVAARDADWLRDEARRMTAEILGEHPDLRGLFAHNVEMAEGAHQAAVAAGRADLPIVAVTGLTGESDGVAAVAEGRFAALVYHSTGGREAVETSRRLLVDCQPVPKRQPLPLRLVTPANVTDFIR
ncbi:ribose transport system substrate-binding protein [Amycolatopsis arida]|uniref:Ribose transport system substrate-binding protein n=1 Tax=Amycolatopsis arida TaxID=587909 RepID=A0A1I6AG44_9PSEU|nr:substrate-binding domain-containing protein [Amycolatopsis arida]TDX97711.1 ribose transport system substrate-binding protein [Amycolatopsis arida]SFQ67640.1 ribose transport system substrate-binding protein [Amycolatopsis arida]